MLPTNPSDNRKLTDGIIFLRPLTQEDAAAHLEGEDDEMAKWLSGGRSTLATVQTFIENSCEVWRSRGPRRAFGVFDCASNRLIGCIEANLSRLADPGQVNVSYGIFQRWRGKGLAIRAINLMGQYLQTATQASAMVLRIAPANAASLKVAEKAGFSFCGEFDEPEGRLVRYVRKLQS